MMIKLLLGSIVLGGFLLQGCVSAGTFRKEKLKYGQTATQLAACNKRYSADEAKIKDQNVLVSNLESKLGSTKSAKKKLQSNVAEMKTALAALTKERAEAEKRIKEFRDLTAKFRALIDSGKLTVKMIDGQMVVSLPSDVLFPSGSAKLSSQGIQAIQLVTSLLISMPKHKFQIEGFTDNVPIHTAEFPSNWELASARALTVLKTMLAAGMPADQVSAASFGDTHPVQSNKSNSGRAANRRIEIVMVPNLSTLPGYDQLSKLSSNAKSTNTKSTKTKESDTTKSSSNASTSGATGT